MRPRAARRCGSRPDSPGDLLAQPQGQVTRRRGAAAARCIVAATQEQLAGRSRALVTAPIHKEALHAAGIDHPGHTELLQALCADPDGSAAGRCA